MRITCEIRMTDNTHRNLTTRRRHSIASHSDSQLYDAGKDWKMIQTCDTRRHHDKPILCWLRPNRSNTARSNEETELTATVDTKEQQAPVLEEDHATWWATSNAQVEKLASTSLGTGPGPKIPAIVRVQRSSSRAAEYNSQVQTSCSYVSSHP